MTNDKLEWNGMERNREVHGHISYNVHACDLLQVVRADLKELWDMDLVRVAVAVAVAVTVAVAVLVAVAVAAVAVAAVVVVSKKSDFHNNVHARIRGFICNHNLLFFLH